VIITRENFGCGSSREHAPWVFEVNDIHTVIAESYARIFRQNMFNCGMLAIELPKADIDRLMALQRQGQVEIAVNLDAQQIVARAGTEEIPFSFEISQFDKALVAAGGWVEFADARY
jgi:3-isopropylmalate/(R)-2-methylmalate dehydratase small subunit